MGKSKAAKKAAEKVIKKKPKVSEVEKVMDKKTKDLLEFNTKRFTPKMEADIEKFNKLKEAGDTAGLDKMKSSLNLNKDADLTEAAIKSHWGSRMANTTLGDQMMYHQAPQKAAAVGGTAFLVSNMSRTKGQLDNSQLYGQARPY